MNTEEGFWLFPRGPPKISFVFEIVVISCIFNISCLQLKTDFSPSFVFAMTGNNNDENKTLNNLNGGNSSNNDPIPPIGLVDNGNMPPQRLVVASHKHAKPQTFSGQNFKRWREQMMFYLTTLNLSKVLTDEVPKLPEGVDHDVQTAVALDVWNQSDYLCRNYILNGLSDELYSIYEVLKTAKAVWEALEYKYKTQDAGTKKFIVAKFLDFRMVDNKTIESQVRDLELIYHEINAEGMTISESFKVAALIEKLPPSWKDFKNYLKHKRKEMTVEEVYLRLKIEEDNRKKVDGNVMVNPNVGGAKANMVELGSSSKSIKGKKKDFKPPARGVAFK